VHAFVPWPELDRLGDRSPNRRRKPPYNFISRAVRSVRRRQP